LRARNGAIPFLRETQYVQIMDASPPTQDDAMRLAAAYLDRWEAHLSLLARAGTGAGSGGGGEPGTAPAKPQVK